MDYNFIISSCDSLIKHWVGYYESDPDAFYDGVQEVRIKLWEALDHKYDSSKGAIYNFCFGVIKQEARKLVLDAHKYRQNHFENGMEVVWYDSSTSYPLKHDGECCDLDYEKFLFYDILCDDMDSEFYKEFESMLTYDQYMLFRKIRSDYDNLDKLYRNSGKLKLKRIAGNEYYGRKLRNTYNGLRRKLFCYAKSRRMMVNLSTAEAKI